MINEEYKKELERIFKLAVDDMDEPEDERKLTQWEQDFVSDWIEKLEKYDIKVMISPKQYDIIERIRAKLDGETTR